MAAALQSLEWVYNNVKFEPYIGSMKGPEATEQSKAGNDWDQSLLLIEKLEEAVPGIEANLMFGAVEAASLDVARWLGVDNESAAEAVLQWTNLSELNSTYSADDSGSIRFLHAWVRVNLPGIGERDIDPSWKYLERRDGIAVVDFNPSSYWAQTGYELPYQLYEAQIVGDQDFPTGKSLADVPNEGAIIAKRFTAVPESSDLPFELIPANPPQIVDDVHNVTWYSFGERDMTHRVRLKLKQENEIVFDHTMSVADVALDTITVRYVSGGGTPSGYLQAQLFIGGERVEVGGNARVRLKNDLGDDLAVEWVLEHFHPSRRIDDPDDPLDSVDRPSFERRPGQPVAIGLAARQHTAQSLQNIQGEINEKAYASQVDVHSYQAHLLGLVAAKYLYEVETHAARIGRLTHTIVLQPTVGSGLITGGSITVPPSSSGRWRFQNPMAAPDTLIDAPRVTGALFATTEPMNFGSSQFINANRALSYNSFALEHAVLEEVLSLESVSAPKGLQWAHANQLTPVEIPANSPEVQAITQNLFTADVTAVNAAHASGHISETERDDFANHVEYVRGRITAKVQGGFSVTVPPRLVRVDMSINNPNYYRLSGPHAANWIGSVWYSSNPGATAWGGTIVEVGGNEIAGGAGLRFLDQSAPHSNWQFNSQLKAGDPVNTFTGNVTHDETDLDIPNLGYPLRVARHYDSLMDIENGFGFGWNHIYGDLLEVEYDPGDIIERVTWVTSENRRYTFTSTNGQDFTTTDGLFGKLTLDATGRLKYRDVDGLTRTFLPYGNEFSRTRDELQGSNIVPVYRTGYLFPLDEVVDRNGNGVDIKYQAGSLTRIDKVADLRDDTRFLKFNYDEDSGVGDRILSVDDFTGRRVSFRYKRIAQPNNPNSEKNYLEYARSAKDATVTYADTNVAVYRYFTVNRLHGLLHTIQRVAKAGDDPLNPGAGSIDRGTHTYEYHANRRAFSTTDAEGNSEYFSFNLFVPKTMGFNAHYTWTTTHTDVRGESTIYRFNDEGLTDSVILPDRSRTKHFYWESGYKHNLLKESVDALGRHDTFEYDTNGNLSVHVATDGIRTNYNYNVAAGSFNQLNNVLITGAGTGAGSRSTEYAYDPQGNVETVTRHPRAGANEVTRYVYPGAGNRGLPLSVTRPKGTVETGDYTTTFTYNAGGQVLTESTDLLSTKQWEYNARGYLEKEIDATNRVVMHTPDVLGRVLETTIPDPDAAEWNPENLDGDLDDLTTKYTYIDGLRSSMEDPRHETTTYIHDPLGRIRRVTYADGTFSTSEYDAAGNVTRAMDELGRATAFFFDSRGRRTQTLFADGAFDRVTYDGAGRVIAMAEPLNRVTPYGLDDVAKTIREYDDGDRLWFEQDAEGQITTIDFNAFGEVDAESFYKNRADFNLSDEYRTIIYQVDDLGRQIERRGNDGVVTSTGYDEHGNVEKEIRYDVTGSWESDNPAVFTIDLDDVNVPRRTTTTVYDVLDRPIKVVLDRPTEISDAAEQITQTDYDEAGRVLRITDPRGVKTTGIEDDYVTIRTYDGAGRLVSEILPDPDGPGNPTLSGPKTIYRYDENGNLTSSTNPREKTTSFTYDDRNRQTDVDYHDDTTTHTEFNDAGEVEWQTDQRLRRTDFEYDVRGRVIKEMLPELGGPSPRLFRESVFNAAGNLVKEVDEVGAITIHDYDALHRVIRSGVGGITITNVTAIGDTVVVDTDGPHGYQTGDRVELSSVVAPDYGGVFSVTWVDDDTFSIVAPALVKDTFDRADEPLDFAETGQAWNPNYAAGWHVTGNEAVADPGVLLQAHIDAGVSDGTVTATIGSAVAFWGLIGRMTDANNFLLAGLGATAGGLTDIALWRVSNGTFPTVGAIAHRPVQAGDTLSLRASGNLITVYHNGEALVGLTDIAEPFNEHATKWGMRYYHATETGRFRDFFFHAAPADLVAHNPSTIYDYDHNELVAVTDPRGFKMDSVYDKAGNVTEEWAWKESIYDGAPANKEKLRTNTWDALGQLKNTSDAMNRATFFDYDLLGRKIREVAPDAGPNVDTPVTHYRYDDVGNLKFIVDPLGSAQLSGTHPSEAELEEAADDNFHTTTYAYDALNRRLAEARPDPDRTGPTTNGPLPPAVTHWRYDENGNVIEQTDPVGNVTYFQYDDLDRLSQEVTNYGYLNPDDTQAELIRDYSYWENGTPKTITDRNGRLRTFTYDALDRLTHEYWGTEASHSRDMRFEYDNAGRLILAADPNTADNYGYDRLGRATAYDNGGMNTGLIVDFASRYDANGNREHLAAGIEGNTDFENTYEYDHRGYTKLVKQDGPTSATKQAMYTPNLLSQTSEIRRYMNATNPSLVAETINSYDSANQLTDISHNAGDAGAYHFDRDVAGRIATMHVNGQPRVFGYDATDQLTSEPSKGYSYDENGNRTSDLPGHAIGADNRILNDGTFSYQYDAEGNRTKRVNALAGQVTDYTYDHRNRLTSVQAGPATAEDLGEVTPSVSSGAVAWFDGGASLPAGTYRVEYVSGAVDWTGGVQDDWTVNHPNEGYHYFVVGDDGTGSTLAPGTIVASHATAAAAQEASAGMSVPFTHAGGKLGVYMWDSDYSNNLPLDPSVGAPTFRLVPAGLEPMTATYTYDTDDRRVSKTVNFVDPSLEDVAESYVYDGPDVVMVFDVGGGDYTLTHRYLHGPGFDEPLAEDAITPTGNVVTWNLGDHQGSVRTIVAEDGTVLKTIDYDAFGNLNGVGGRFGWTGQQYDPESGLSYFGGRYYDPITGGFVTQDPAEQYTQPYLFGGNNAPNMIDPSGYTAFGAGMGSTIGGAIGGGGMSLGQVILGAITSVVGSGASSGPATRPSTPYDALDDFLINWQPTSSAFTEVALERYLIENGPQLGGAERVQAAALAYALYDEYDAIAFEAGQARDTAGMSRVYGGKSIRFGLLSKSLEDMPSTGPGLLRRMGGGISDFFGDLGTWVEGQYGGIGQQVAGLTANTPFEGWGQWFNQAAAGTGGFLGESARTGGGMTNLPAHAVGAADDFVGYRQSGLGLGDTWLLTAAHRLPGTSIITSLYQGATGVSTAGSDLGRSLSGTEQAQHVSGAIGQAFLTPLVLRFGHRHHVATDKHRYWTPVFQELFDNAGLSMQNWRNLARVKGHKGPHPERYHMTVLSRLQSAVADHQPFTGGYTRAFAEELLRIRKDVRTPRSELNLLVRYPGAQ